MTTRDPNERKIRRTLRAYQRAVTEAPTKVELRFGLANYLAELGYEEQAVQEYELCAKLLAARGELIKAISCCKKLMKLDPSRTDVLLFLTRHYADSSQAGATRIAKPVRPVVLEDVSDDEPIVRLTQSDVTGASPRPVDFGTKSIAIVAPESATEPGSPRDTGIAGETSDPIEEFPLTVLTLDGEEEYWSDDDLIDLDAPDTPDPEDAPDLEVHRVNLDPAPIRNQQLPKIPLFSSLGPAAFREFLEKLELRKVPPAEVIIEARSPGDTRARGGALYILVSGHVHVSYVREDGVTVELGQIAIGGVFGEFELLTGRPTRVQMRSTQESELLVLSRTVLDEICVRSPMVRSKLWNFYHSRLVRDFLARSPLFDSLDADARDRVARKFEAVTYDEGQLIADVGHQLQGLYLLREGAGTVERDGRLIRRLMPGQFYGVAAAVGGAPATSSLRAEQASTLLLLRNFELRNLLRNHPRLERDFRALAATREKLVAQPDQAFVDGTPLDVE